MVGLMTWLRWSEESLKFLELLSILLPESGIAVVSFFPTIAISLFYIAASFIRVLDWDCCLTVRVQGLILNCVWRPTLFMFLLDDRKSYSFRLSPLPSLSLSIAPVPCVTYFDCLSYSLPISGRISTIGFSRQKCC